VSFAELGCVNCANSICRDCDPDAQPADGFWKEQMTTPDIAGLCERLRYRLDLESDNPYVVSAWSADDVLTRIVPHADLEEIADTLERQAAEIERLRDEIMGMKARLLRWEPRPLTDMSQILTGEALRSSRAALTGEDAGGKG